MHGWFENDPFTQKWSSIIRDFKIVNDGSDKTLVMPIFQVDTGIAKTKPECIS